MNYLLKRLYQSEINVQINWMYDAGVNVKLGDKMNGFTHEKNFNGEDFEPIEQWLEETAKREFPKSVFARFYNKSAEKCRINELIKSDILNHFNDLTVDEKIGDLKTGNEIIYAPFDYLADDIMRIINAYPLSI